jgi:hypothetical protein
MAGVYPVALVATTLTDTVGLSKELVGPPGTILPTPALTPRPVTVGKGLEIATVGFNISSHGNPIDPLLPGYNPMCAKATIGTTPIARVTVNGKPVAIAEPTGKCLCTCGHIVLGPGAPNVTVGV